MTQALRFLLDTNAISEPLRPRPNEHLLEQWRQHSNEVAISSTVWHELTYGLEKLPKSRKRDLITGYLEDLHASALPILPYDDRAAEWHAKERARLGRKGRTLPFRDSQIASVAKVHDLVLVTANLSDFEGLQGLEIVDWTKPVTE